MTAERKRPMSKARARREAASVVARLIDSYRSVGQPADDCTDRVRGWIPEDEDVLDAAFVRLRDELDRRGRHTP
jgi:hypothetical protein